MKEAVVIDSPRVSEKKEVPSLTDFRMRESGVDNFDDNANRENSSMKLKVTFWTLCSAALVSGAMIGVYGVKTLKSKQNYEDSQFLDADARADTIHNKRMSNIFVAVSSLLAAGAVTVKLMDIRLSRKKNRSLSMSIDISNKIGVQGRF